MLTELNITSTDASRRLGFLSNNRIFFENNIATLVLQKEGLTFMQEKVQWVLEIYKESLMKTTCDKKEELAPLFGTREQWIAFCDSLFSLYYGNPVFIL